MKMCQSHWNKLRAAIKERGLEHLVSKDGAEAVQQLKEELEGTSVTYDPLMRAHNMILSRALECGGLYLMGQKEDGSDYCPLCEVDAHAPARDDKPESDHWVTGCTDSILRHCRELGVVPKVS